MAELRVETTSPQRSPHGTRAPVLSASVRRHLGKTLRSFYAPALAEPVSERMEALLARLQAQKSER